MSTISHADEAGTDNISVHKYSTQTQHSSHQPPKMQMEIVSEITATSSTLTQLLTWEDFII
jgi:hypothetical protein